MAVNPGLEQVADDAEANVLPMLSETDSQREDQTWCLTALGCPSRCAPRVVPLAAVIRIAACRLLRSRGSIPAPRRVLVDLLLIKQRIGKACREKFISRFIPILQKMTSSLKGETTWICSHGPQFAGRRTVYSRFENAADRRDLAVPLFRLRARALCPLAVSM